MPAFENSPEVKTKRRRYLGKVPFFVVSIFSIFFVIMSLLTLFGSSCRNLELLTHLRVQLILPLIALVPVLLLMKSRVMLMLVSAAICVHLVDILPLYFPQHKRAPVVTVRILTMNVNSLNQNFAGVRKLIDSEGADVVCLQELAPAMADSLTKNLSAYPHRFVEAREGNFGIGIFSKYDLQDRQELKLCPDDILTVSATIVVHGTKIKLINTHPIAPLNDLYYAWRNEQLDALADITSKSEDPVIVVGDLNVSYFSPFFKRLLNRGHLTDSEFGFGIQPSWSAQKWPLNAPIDCVLFRLPLDHVLTKGPIDTFDRRLLYDIGSDHLPLFVKLGLPAGKEAR